MSDAAFLDAILANPSEDGPRLVYADWLDEHGDPRGELIRVQCELAQLPAGDPKRPRLAAREKKLLKRHGRDWAGPALRTAFRWQFRRGFLHWVSARPDQFLAHGAEWFAATPTLETLTFNDADGRVGEVVGSPIL